MTLPIEVLSTTLIAPLGGIIVNRLRLAVPSPFGWCFLFAVVSGFVHFRTNYRLGNVFQIRGTLDRFPVLARMVMVFIPGFLLADVDMAID